MPSRGTYVAPAIIELDRAEQLKEEVFGPVLHVVRWRADEFDRLLADLAGNGTALTLGIHSRIDATVERIAARLSNGNVYVNRNMIGAVVGSQPFGGSGLSGTGPKAGGPNYLHRFATRTGGDGEHRRIRRQRHAAGGRGDALEIAWTWLSDPGSGGCAPQQTGKPVIQLAPLTGLARGSGIVRA